LARKQQLGVLSQRYISQAKIRAVVFTEALADKATMFPPLLVFARKSGQKFYWNIGYKRLNCG